MLKKDKNYKQIFFDLDGTLLDTAPEFSRSINNLTLKRLNKEISFNEIRNLVSDGVGALVKLVKTCSDLCKSGGTIVFSTINRNPKSFLFAIVGAEYVLNLLPKGTHEYNKFIKPSELSSMMRDNFLEVCEVKGMSYNPITKNYWLGKNVDVNYLIHAKKR